MDVVARCGGEVMWFHVSVVDLAAPTYLDGAAKTGGGAAEARAKEKQRRWRAIAREHGTNFPLVIETSGRLSKSFAQFRSRIAEILVEEEGAPWSTEERKKYEEAKVARDMQGMFVTALACGNVAVEYENRTGS